ncbi:hypothetical protein BDY21DRAFT_85710 [Lineolata rhizophorae]|uniref:Uncharacterized protein n=1 Tax=Lineolata rhizophorae TaxID=578093 RepID=A0A6A6PDC1_9PEZI|nr:hypothetical protein BDY21DRAFT_85710 [Lineolata rhizophorae]
MFNVLFGFIFAFSATMSLATAATNTTSAIPSVTPTAGMTLCGSIGFGPCEWWESCEKMPGADCEPFAPDDSCVGACARREPVECGSRGLPGCDWGAGERCVQAPWMACGPESDCGGLCVTKWDLPDEERITARDGLRA